MGTEKIGMAVVVKQAGNGARPGYYVHEICDSKGNYVDLDTNGNVIKNRPPLTCYPLQARLPICRRINLLHLYYCRKMNLSTQAGKRSFLFL